MDDKKYDLVWFTPNIPHERAQALTRQAIRPRRNLGIRIRESMRLPLVDGTPRGDEGCLFIVGQHGTLGFDPDPRDKTQPLKNVMIEVLEPGLVVGNFTEAAWTSPEFERESKIEQVAEATESDAIARRQAERHAINAQSIDAANRRYLVTIGHLMRLERPSQVSNQELADVGLAGVMMGRDIPNQAEFVGALCPMDVETQTESCPSEIVNNWRARAALLASRVGVRPGVRNA